MIDTIKASLQSSPFRWLTAAAAAISTGAMLST